jgi:hypothetical protein
MANNEHPVWDVYNLYRTARLNVRYYEERLGRITLYNNVIEWIIAVATPTTALGAFLHDSPLLDNGIGSISWQIVAGLAAFLTSIKQYFQFPKKIGKMEHALSAYRALEFDLEQIVLKIKKERTYSKISMQMFDEAQKKKGKLVCDPPENKQDKKLIQKMTDEVLEKLPLEFFYEPEEIS